MATRADARDITEARRRIGEHLDWLLERVYSGRMPAPPAGKGSTYDHGDYTTRIGREHDGRYYADARWEVNEGYDDDYGSQTCGTPFDCPLQGQPHEHLCCHAADLEGLRAAPLA